MHKQISISDLQIGMFVCGTDRKWLDIPFFRKKFLITSNKQIEELRVYCKFVYIDTEKGIDVIAEPEPEAEIEFNESHVDDFIDNKIPARNDENNLFKKIYDDSKTTFSEILNDIRLNRDIDTAKIQGLVREFLVCIETDSQAMTELLRFRDNGDPLARKSVNVCILSLVFGKYIGINDDKKFALGMGALLHDIGMTSVPDSILLKSQPLTADERAIIEKHTEHGLKILAKIPRIPQEVLKIVYSHHERMDGKGYPRQLQGNQIDLLVRLVTIASIYEALTTDRLYGEKLSPITALRYLHVSGGTITDSQLMEKFIMALGIFPADYVVELASGELAVIANVAPRDQSRPVLHIVTNPQKQLLQQEYAIDLQEQNNDDISIVKIFELNNPIVELIMAIREQTKA